MRILELREYAAVKKIVDEKDSAEEDWPASDMVEDVLAARERQLSERR
jgi:hypothetical protein